MPRAYVTDSTGPLPPWHTLGDTPELTEPSPIKTCSTTTSRFSNDVYLKHVLSGFIRTTYLYDAMSTTTVMNTGHIGV
ncbi:hypothetical protein TgHK011_005270 [Trichoderma gracile]|nr:hypothetical protein TgHK011_005270 [Trichoderma gracile]